MKARVKATGEIVDVQKISDYDSHGKYIGYYFQTINSPFKAFHNGDLDFEYLDREPDNYWEKLKHQYAGMAMQGLMSYVEQITPKEGRSFCDEIVGISFKVAHALVEKLKSESNGN